MLSNLVSLLVCSATGLLVLARQRRARAAAGGRWSRALAAAGPRGARPRMLREVFLWGAGGDRWIVDGSLALFAFTSLLAFGYYGERCLTLLVECRGRRLFRLVGVGVLVLACSLNLPGLWWAAETVEALMVLPKLLALLLLASLVFPATRGGAGGAQPNP